MYFLIISFAVSLLGITFMVGRKLLMIQNGQIVEKEGIIFEAPPFEEWKHSAVKNIKRYGYLALVATIRLYFRSLNFLKSKWTEIKTKIANMRSKKLNAEERKEVSKFLKMIGEYKHKIRTIKHKIKEEESL